MKKVTFRIISFLFCFILMFTVASCKSDKETENSAVSGSSSIKQESPSDSPSQEEENSEVEGFVEDPQIEDIPVAERPYTDLAESIGFFSGEPYDGIIDEDIDIGDGLGEIDDIIDEESYEPFLQVSGKKVNGSRRDITVDNNQILFRNFHGFGANVFPTHFTYDAQVNAGDIPAYSEIYSERLKAIDCSYARSWFQIDWMITNEAGEDFGEYKDKPEKNPDAINYYNGIYDFENEYMQSAIEYWKMLEEAGTEVYLAFGWKNGTRIQHWFGSCPDYPDMAAPRDVEQYADAAAALFKYCRNEIGLTNFNTLSYYNEPNNINARHDFNTIGDKRIVYVKMLEAAHKVFDNDSELKDVKFVVADDAWDLALRSDIYVNVYLNNYASEYVDIFSQHCYATVYDNIQKGKAYDALCNRFLGAYYFYKKPIWLTEYYCGGKDIVKSEEYNWEVLNGWNASFAAYYIACANNGVGTILKWTVHGAYLVDPQKFTIDGDTSSWARVVDDSSINTLYYGFYEESLLSNYIKNDSCVNYLSWLGDDIRCAAFTSKDGKDFSLIVEANEKTSKKKLNVTLMKALNKDINVFRFGWDVEKNAQATIIPNEAVLKNISTRFNYEISGDYGIYVFTTYKPLEQIEVYKPGTDESAVHVECSANGTVSIEPRFVDNVQYDEPTASKENFKWEIKQYSEVATTQGGTEQKIVRREKTDPDNCGKLDVSANGVVTYTPASNAKSGDLIALRCTYKNGKEFTFATTMIKIQ